MLHTLKQCNVILTFEMVLGAEGVKAEDDYAKDGTLPDPSSTDNPEFKIVLGLIRDGLAADPQKWHRMAAKMVGVSEETTTGVKRLYEMTAQVRRAWSLIVLVTCMVTTVCNSVALQKDRERV